MRAGTASSPGPRAGPWRSWHRATLTVARSASYASVTDALEQERERSVRRSVIFAGSVRTSCDGLVTDLRCAILRRPLFSKEEGLGSLLLTATVVGSGIMAERLSGGNVAIALLANTAATVAALTVLIALLGPVSGAHFNPTVSVIEALRGRLAWRDAGTYTFVQIIGCCAGALTAHMMFELPVWHRTRSCRA
jgi:hypothetical protein